MDTRHTHLVALLEAAGLRADLGGACNGYAQMVGMAILSGEMEAFDKRSEWLNTIDPETFKDQLENARQEVTHLVSEAKQEAQKIWDEVVDRSEEKTLNEQKNETLAQKIINQNKRQKQFNDLIQKTLEEKIKLLNEYKKTTIENSYNLLNLNTFLQAVEMHFQPIFYSDWFAKESRPSTQDSSKTWPLLLPKKLDNTKIHERSFCGAYDKNELDIYLHSLEKAMQNSQHPIALTLNSGGHAITIGYDGKKWIFSDINQSPTKYFDNANNNEMKELIFIAFKSSKYVIFNTEIKSTTDETTLDQFISMCRPIHTITPAKSTQYKGSEQQTLLHVAAQNNHLSVAEDLLRNSANVNAERISGATPLFIAAQNGHLEMVKFLIRHRANINAARKDTATAIHIAAQFGHLEVIKFLIENGADARAEMGNGVTPLYSAALNGHLEVVEYLDSLEVNINAGTTNNETPLYIAAKNGHLKVVEFLINHEAEVNEAKIDDSTTSLFVAAENGHSEVVKFLIKHGADVNARDLDDVSPLHIAALKGHFSVVNALVIYGKPEIDVNAAREDGYTPLHVATENGHLEMVNALIDAGAFVNATENEGVTPLDLAVIGDHLNVVNALLVKPHAYSLSQIESALSNTNTQTNTQIVFLLQAQLLAEQLLFALEKCDKTAKTPWPQIVKLQEEINEEMKLVHSNFPEKSVELAKSLFQLASRTSIQVKHSRSSGHLFNSELLDEPPLNKAIENFCLATGIDKDAEVQDENTVRIRFPGTAN